MPQARIPLKSSQEIQFHSEKGSKADRKVDPFAEQNAKRAEAKKLQTKKHRIFVGAGAIIMIGTILVIILTIFLAGNDGPEIASSEINEKEAQTVYQDAIKQINTGAIDGFPTENDISEANTIFEDSISQAIENKDTNAADALRIAQMMFYNDVSTEYARIIEIGESVENIQALEQMQQLRYYSLMATAYSETGDRDRSVEAYFKAVVLAESIEN